MLYVISLCRSLHNPEKKVIIYEIYIYYGKNYISLASKWTSASVKKFSKGIIENKFKVPISSYSEVFLYSWITYDHILFNQCKYFNKKVSMHIATDNERQTDTHKIKY